MALGGGHAKARSSSMSSLQTHTYKTLLLRSGFRHWTALCSDHYNNGANRATRFE